jgi:membrane associated rhomboid family serine protease
MNPHAKVTLFFLLPMELWQGLAAAAVFDVVGLLGLLRFRIDHAAHLGGMAAGLLYARYGGDLWAKRDVASARLRKLLFK